MRSLSRGGAGQWPRGALVATGLGLGAVGGFIGSLVHGRRGAFLAVRGTALAQRVPERLGAYAPGTREPGTQKSGTQEPGREKAGVGGAGA
jgi:hypothetical protein